MSKQEIKILGITNEVDNIYLSDTDSNDFHNQLAFIGKAAGVCYATENDFSNSEKNIKAALKRAKTAAEMGHHSIYDHVQLNLLVKVPKIIAMILNSLGCYATSEKSARYTKMSNVDPTEKELYDKWMGIFNVLIRNSYDKLDEKKVEKLAMENARYMTSIFTPTTMVYTTSYRQLCYIYEWFKKLVTDCVVYDNDFNKAILNEAADFITALTRIIKDEDVSDQKNQRLRFLRSVRMDKDAFDKDARLHEYKKDYFGDSYTVSYKCSFACLAQAQRHRTLRYEMFILSAGDCGFYIPEILRGTEYEEEWTSDLVKLAKEGHWPQATKVWVTEQGIFEDFALKCKERLCGCAQLEVMRLTEETLLKFWNDNLMYIDKAILCSDNIKLLGSMLSRDHMTGKVNAMPRCRFSDYSCPSKCSFGVHSLERHI